MQSFKHDLINYDHLKSAKMMFMLFKLRSDFFINKISNKNIDKSVSRKTNPD